MSRGHPLPFLLVLAPGSARRSQISYLSTSTLQTQQQPRSSLSFCSQGRKFCFKTPPGPEAAGTAAEWLPTARAALPTWLLRVNPSLQLGCCWLAPACAEEGQRGTRRDRGCGSTQEGEVRRVLQWSVAGCAGRVGVAAGMSMQAVE